MPWRLNILLSLLIGASALANPTCLETLQRTMESDEALIARAQIYASELLAKRGPLHTPEQEGFGGGVVRVETGGVPSHLKLYAKKKGEVFRHYVTGRMQSGQWHDADETTRAILKSGRLVAGFTPYVKSDTPPKWYFERFPDLTGVFLTKPAFEAEQIGVFPTSYIDLELDDGIPVIELEPGKIYFIPGPPKELVVPFLVAK